MSEATLQLLINDAAGQKAKGVMEQALAECQFARIAVAFVTKAGVELLGQPLRACIRRGSRIRLVAGEDFCLTDPDALLNLAGIGVEVKLFSAQGRGVFHPKLFLFSKESQASLIVGSANLTAEALRHNVEAGLLVQSDIKNRTIGEAGKFFAGLWNNRKAFQATESYLERYRAGYNRAKRARATGEEALRVAEPEVQYAPERKPKRCPPVREMCQAVMQIGERVHYSEVAHRVVQQFAEWEHGVTPDASIRRDLMQFSTKHQSADEALFAWDEKEPGFYTRLR